MDILPGVLAYDEIDFKQRILHPELRKVAETFHVDVLDGSMFGANCWADAKTVGTWKNLPDIELHLMVRNPLKVAENWYDHVSAFKRVIVHYEIGKPLIETVKTLKALRLEVVIAINPITPVDVIKDLDIDALLIMGVEPGKSGQPFLGEPILAKIRRAHTLFPKLTIEVDGGVNSSTIKQIKLAGASRCVASSWLWKAENPTEAYSELQSKIS